MEDKKAVFWLKLSFLVGTITDALALFPMLFPPLAKIFWGFDKFSGVYYFAMGYGAALMLAWTMLLVWAIRKPLERRFIALFTAVVIVGFVVTEVIALVHDYIQTEKILPTFGLQAILLILFTYSFLISGKKKSILAES